MRHHPTGSVALRRPAPYRCANVPHRARVRFPAGYPRDLASCLHAVLGRHFTPKAAGIDQSRSVLAAGTIPLSLTLTSEGLEACKERSSRWAGRDLSFLLAAISQRLQFLLLCGGSLYGECSQPKSRQAASSARNRCDAYMKFYVERVTRGQFQAIAPAE